MLRVGSVKLVTFRLIALAFLFPQRVLSQTIHYTPTDARSCTPIANPERGFYSHEEFEFGGAEGPLTLSHLKKLYEIGDDQSNKRISLILRIYYLGKFLNQPLPPEALQLIRDDLTTLRRAGMKALLRFAYTQEYVDPPQSNDTDARPDQAIAHIRQLRALFEKYQDVIAVVQTGFVGSWGEWYSANGAYGPPFDSAHPLDQDRRRIITELLNALPNSSAIQLRSHFYKNKFGLSDTDPNFNRIGFHNDALGGPLSFQGILYPVVDCFFKGDDPACRELSKQTSAVPMGGESGNAHYLAEPEGSNKPNTNLVWPVVAKEFARNHWSYLNPRKCQEDKPADCLKNPNSMIVETTWAGHFVELNNRLGYRFVLISADFKQSVQQGEDVVVTIALKNDGWAAPFNKRNLELVLRPDSCKDQYVCAQELVAAELKGDTDPRKWLPIDHLLGDIPNPKQPTYTFSGTFKSPGAETYTLSLRLRDPIVEEFFTRNVADCKSDEKKCLYDLSTTGRFSIRMANAEEKGFRWEELTGLNQLGTVKVAAAK